MNLLFSTLKQELVYTDRVTHEQVPFHLLSDGVRCTLAMVMELAFRCYILNPHLGLRATQETNGVVLIDEIDLHLHPSWQKHVINDFCKAILPMGYRDFRDKARLNEVLRLEQHGICCYCEKRIDHFQGSKDTGAHNEHLIPENGSHGVFEKQMDYENLYACCIESQGKVKASCHCGEHKKDDVIFPFIQMQDCQQYFRYNVLGEIIPNGEYPNWNMYLDNLSSLSGMVKEATLTIRTLNLNCCSLVNDRRAVLLVLMDWASKQSGANVQDKMKEMEKRLLFPEFIDMQLFFMRKKMEQCQEDIEK